MAVTVLPVLKKRDTMFRTPPELEVALMYISYFVGSERRLPVKPDCAISLTTTLMPARLRSACTTSAKLLYLAKVTRFRVRLEMPLSASSLAAPSGS